MVSKWWTPRRRPFCRTRRRQSKIYVESNDSNFQLIFGDFISMQTLAIYRRLLLRNKPAGFARNRTKRDDRDRAMFFLLRMVFWLGLVLVLLPRERHLNRKSCRRSALPNRFGCDRGGVRRGQFCKRQPAAAKSAARPPP